MRLDHLLSKEHQAPRGTRVPAVAHVFLWSAGYSPGSGFPGPASTRLPACGRGRGAGCGAGAGRARCWVLREPAPLWGGFASGGPASGFLVPGCFPGAGGGGWFGAFLENCTVDASIYLRSSCLRAGGSLRSCCCSACVVPSFLGHTVDALAPGADEGRWSLRYAPGSRQPGCDPGVSEWGNPAAVMGRRRRLNA